jgi:flagellar biosynthesis/type III secretory pathway protein FliH
MTTIARARIIKGAFASSDDPNATRTDDVAVALAAEERWAHRVSKAVLDARTEAQRIIDDAHVNAAAIVADAAADAATEAREQEIARLAAGFLELRAREAKKAETDIDRIIELSVLLAERLMGEALRVEPARIAELAATAIQEARGARRVQIDACPEDVPALTETLAAIGQIAEVRPDSTLTRGSLIVNTDLGHVDARLTPQLSRLAAALKEALK